LNLIDTGILAGMAPACHIVSTLIIRPGTARLKTGDAPCILPESNSNSVFDFASTRFWIDPRERLMIFILASAQQLSALAIIIGVKQFVRGDDIRQNPSYDLLGMPSNLTVAIAFALSANRLIGG
jgi:hypothetical protein